MVVFRKKQSWEFRFKICGASSGNNSTHVKKISSDAILNQSYMSSEWRHVPSISTNNKVLQETPPRAQFLSYDHLSYSIWRGISRATKLPYRIFQILKIPKKSIKFLKVLYFQNIFPLKTKFSKKYAICLMAMADEYVYKISSRYLQKWLSYELWHNTCWKQPNLPIFAILFFHLFWFFKKCFWVIFRVLCERLT